MSEEVILKLTIEQARKLYRLIYDHGHWKSARLFIVKNRLAELLEIDAESREEAREDKDKRVGKLFRLYQKGGPQVLADVLELGPPEAINVEASAWQDLEAIWNHLNTRKQHFRQTIGQLAQAARHKPFAIASVCRNDLVGILAGEEIAQLSDADMEEIADRMSDAYRDAGGYWESLEIMARFVLKRKEEVIG